MFKNGRYDNYHHCQHCYLEILRDFNDTTIDFIYFTRFSNKTIVENPKCLQSVYKNIFITHVTRHVVNNAKLHYTFTIKLFFVTVQVPYVVNRGKIYGTKLPLRISRIWWAFNARSHGARSISYRFTVALLHTEKYIHNYIINVLVVGFFFLHRTHNH